VNTLREVTPAHRAFALSYGPEVEVLRAESAEGTILTILSNALYLETSEGLIVCIAAEDAENGPLTLRVSGLPTLLASLRASNQHTFRANGHGIRIGDAVYVEWEQAPAWSPVQPGHLATELARRAAAEELARVKPVFARSDPGISQVESRTREKLQAGTEALRAAILSFDSAEMSGAAIALIGLGPGLTPSGDDIVMGAAAMLVWRARLGGFPPDSLEFLVATIREEAPHRTNRISARLLEYACRGVLYAPAMELGTALLAGDISGVGVPAERLLAIGSSTGMNMAAGLAAGLPGQDARGE
jgi:hypothetical protein